VKAAHLRFAECRPVGRSTKYRNADIQETAAEGRAIKTINLKSDMPSVPEALRRLDREIALARQEKHSLLKVIHGYGSTGAGGDIRIAVQRRLHDLAEAGQVRDCIFGENWSKTDDATWRLLQAQSDLKSDLDLGRRNQGITVVLL
jgi:hypothetical protein